MRMDLRMKLRKIRSRCGNSLRMRSEWGRLRQNSLAIANAMAWRTQARKGALRGHIKGHKKGHIKVRTRSTTTRDGNLQFRGAVSTGGSPLDFLLFLQVLCAI